MLSTFSFFNPFLWQHFCRRSSKKWLIFLVGQQKSILIYLFPLYTAECAVKKLTFLIFMPFHSLLFPFRQMLNIIFGFQASYKLNGVGMEVISLKLFISGRICNVRMMSHSIVNASCLYDDGCVTYMQDKCACFLSASFFV